MLWFLAPLLAVHIVCMTFWMGSMLFGTVLGGQGRVEVALRAHPGTASMVGRLYTVFPVAILVGVITGVLLGTVFGPVKSVGLLFGSAFGLTMSTAFVLVLVALAFGPAGPPNKPAWLKVPGVGEVAILAAFGCMVLMHFGL